MASETPKLLWNAENIKDVAESVGISALNEEAVKALAQDVEYRIGQVMIESLRLMRAARRTRLTVNDVSLALRVLDAEPLYGYDSTRPLRFGEASLGPGQPLFYIDDEEVEFEKLINAPLPRVPRDVGFTAHWLAIEGVQPSIPQNPTPAELRSQDLLPKGAGGGAGGAGGANPALLALAGNCEAGGLPITTTANGANAVGGGGSSGGGGGGGSSSGGGGGGGGSNNPSVKHIVSKELILYFDKIQAAILDDTPDEEVVRLRQAALGSVRDDPGLHQLAPYFINFIMDRVTHQLDDIFTLRQMMELTNALVENKSLFLDPYASSLSAPVLTCLMARKLGSDDENSNSNSNSNGGGGGGGGGQDAVREQYELRQLAASLIGRMAHKYAASNSLLRPKLTRTCLRYFLDPTKPPAVLYGAVKGILEAGGPEAVRVLVLCNLRSFDSGILQPLRDRGAEGSIEYEMLVQALVQAVASLASQPDKDGGGQQQGQAAAAAAANGNGSGDVVTPAQLAELNEFVGPTVGSRIVASNNPRLVRTILEARAFE